MKIIPWAEDNHPLLLEEGSDKGANRSLNSHVQSVSITGVAVGFVAFSYHMA